MTGHHWGYGEGDGKIWHHPVTINIFNHDVLQLRTKFEIALNARVALLPKDVLLLIQLPESALTHNV